MTSDREAARRQHRAIGLYAALFCWSRQLDGVAIESAVLKRLLGLWRLDPDRVKWFVADLKPFFEHHRKIGWSGGRAGTATLYFARKGFTLPSTGHPLTTEARLRLMAESEDAAAPRIGVLELWQPPDAGEAVDQDISALEALFDARNPDERILTAYLALLSSGQISLLEVPGLIKPRKK